MLNLETQNELREIYRRKRPGWQPATERYAHLCHSQISEDDLIMDLGCGRGGLIEQLNHANQKQFGMDLDFDSLLNHRLAGFPRIFAASDHPPLTDDCVDHVICSWLLEHLNEPEKTFRQIRRILKPGGLFFFITPNGKHPLALLNRFFGRLHLIQGLLVERIYGRSPEDTFPTRYLANSVRDLTNLAQEAGLEIVGIYPIQDPTYLALSPGLFPLAQIFEESLPQNYYTHLVGMMQAP